MKLHVIVLSGLCCLVGCRKPPPPAITGSFEGQMSQTVYMLSQRRPQSLSNRFDVTLSDPQEGSTAVRFALHDAVAGRDVSCTGRATRTDRDDGASYAVPSLTCHLTNADGTSRYQSPQCVIQSQAVGLRFDRTANQLTLDVGSLDVAFTTTPPEDRDPCNNWIRAQAPTGTALRAQAPAATAR